jgi:hypothetical protein
MVAMFEARVLFGSPSTPGGVVPRPARLMVVLLVTVDPEAVLNLTDDVEANVVSTTAQELTGDWRSYTDRTVMPGAGEAAPHSGAAPTQQLGAELFRLGAHQGAIGFSATLPEYKILAIFAGRLKGTSSFLRYTYHDDRGVVRIVEIPAK